MRALVFVGPTISIKQAKQVCDALYLPPISQGDLYQFVSKLEPSIVGIIDGIFQHVPSVWHKEILWAMDRGVHVFGSSSMGALRAAELHTLGMNGIGQIFEAYRDKYFAPYKDEIFEDEDEVAIIHGPEELGFMALSDAMVNIRATLAIAAATNVIDKTTRDQLIQIAKSTFYQKRNYSDLLENAVREDLNLDKLEKLKQWLPSGKIDLKQTDALQMLETVDELCKSKLEPKKVDYFFCTTTLWENAIAEWDDKVILEHTDTNLHEVIDELRLDPESYIDVRRLAVFRTLALAEFERCDLNFNESDFKETLDEHRMKNALYTQKQLRDWAEDNCLDDNRFTKFIEAEIKLRKLESNFKDGLQEPMIEVLKVKGLFQKYLDRAKQKKHIAQNLDRNAEPIEEQIRLQFLIWYFEKKLKSDIPSNLDTYISKLDYVDLTAFYNAIENEFLYMNNSQF